MLREISPMPITMDRRDTSLTVAKPLGMLESGRKKSRYFSYPPIAELSDVVNNWHVTDALFQLGDTLITTGTNMDEGIALIEQYIGRSNDEYDDHYFWSRLRLAKAYKEIGNDLKYKELLAFIQSKDYSHDSDFKKAFDDHLKH